MPLLKPRSFASLLTILILALAALGLPAAPAARAMPAATYVVDRTDDVIVTGCDVSLVNGDCSLRGAVQLANANPGSTIELSELAVYDLTDNFAAQLVLTATTTIVAVPRILCLPIVNSCNAVIKGEPNWTAELLEVKPGATVVIDEVTFTGGNGTNGGAIRNYGTLTLSENQIFSNTAASYGGGILNQGTLTLTGTVVSGNKATATGGGIANIADAGLAGSVTLINSTVVTNAVLGNLPGQGAGGGIASFNSPITGTYKATLNILNSEILSNTASYLTGYGGGLYLDGNNTLTNTLIQGNIATGGGGVYVHFALVTLEGGRVLSNTALTGAGGGGGFRNDGALALNGTLVQGNYVVGGGGGGIGANGVTTLTDSTLYNNVAENSGGAIFSGGPASQVTISGGSIVSNTAPYGGGLSGYGTYTVTQSADIRDNAAFQGGGVYIFGGGRLVLMSESVVRENVSSGGPLGASAGGGIRNDGTVTVLHAGIFGNRAANGSGGGLYNTATGTVNITDASISDNLAGKGSGGGLVNLGSLTITASAIVSNVASFSGGGITNTGTLNLANTTLSSNSADSTGGGLFNNGAASLNYVTIAANTADSTGGLVTTGTLTMTNTLLGDNSGGDFNDCNGAVTTLGHSLIEQLGGCTLVGPGVADKVGVDPMLGPLQVLGGALQFHDLLDHSPAIDSADPAACLPADQRGVARPIWVLCDIGAIETSSRPFLLFLPLLFR